MVVDRISSAHERWRVEQRARTHHTGLADRLMLDWDKLFKRYVWDDEKTPYFTPVDDLTRSQADNELHVYSLFVGILFAVVAVVAAIGVSSYGRATGLAFYGFSVVCAAVILAFAKHHIAALYCAATPMVAFAFLLLKGFSPTLVFIDHVVILIVLALLVRYSLRVVAIVRRYPDMRPGEPSRGRRRR